MKFDTNIISTCGHVGNGIRKLYDIYTKIIITCVLCVWCMCVCVCVCVHFVHVCRREDFEIWCRNRVGGGGVEQWGEGERERGRGETYGCRSLSLGGGLQPSQEGDSVSRLPLQLPVADELRYELRLLVQTHSTDDAIQPIVECSET